MVTLSASKEKEPLFLVLENTNWLNFQMLKPSQSKRPKSKFSLLNVEIPKHPRQTSLANPTQFYYKIERDLARQDDTYIFHQTYVPEQYTQTIQIWNTTALSMIASKKTTTFIWMTSTSEDNEIVFLHPSKVGQSIEDRRKSPQRSNKWRRPSQKRLAKSWIYGNL